MEPEPGNVFCCRPQYLTDVPLTGPGRAPTFFYTPTGQGSVSEGPWIFDEGTPEGGRKCHCGEIYGWIGCGEAGHFHPLVYHCDRQTCPVCWQTWLRRTTDEGIMRMNWMHRETGLPMHHVVVSFRAEPRSRDEHAAQRKEAVKVLKENGFEGGSLVAHIKPGRPGVHWHSLLLGPEPGGHDKSKWRTGRDDKKECVIDGGRVVLKILNTSATQSERVQDYELDHAVQAFVRDPETDEVKGLHSISWWGCFNSKYVKRDETHTWEYAKCPVCAKAGEDRSLLKYSEPVPGRCGGEAVKTYTRTVAYSFRDAFYKKFKFVKSIVGICSKPPLILPPLSAFAC